MDDEFSTLLHGLEGSSTLFDSLGVVGDEATRPIDSELNHVEVLVHPLQHEDATSSDLSDGDRDPPPAETTQTPPHILAAKRRYREKQKHELRQLRAASNELTSRLDHLEAKRAASRMQLMSMKGRVPGWRGVAIRQLRRRLEAEEVNRHLWTQIRAHHTLAEHAKSALKLRLNDFSIDRPMKYVPTGDKPVMKLSEFDRRLVTTFANEMGPLYRQTESVFANCELPSPGDARYHSHESWKWDQEGKSQYIEMVESFMIPFEIDDAVGAFHSAMLQLMGEECAPDVLVTSEPNTVATKSQFDSSCTEPSSPIYQSAMVSRGFVDGDRTTFVWRSYTEKQGSDAKYVEAGWIVVRRGARAADGSTGTLVQMCSRFRPLHWSGRSDLAARPSDEYLDMMVNTGEEDALVLTQAIENVMLNQLVATKTAKSPPRPHDGQSPSI